jgi:hypothetical protein
MTNPQNAADRSDPARAHQPGEASFRIIHSEDVSWQAFPAFPSEARLAILVGDPTRPGPYVIRVRLPAGVKMMPHKHPEDRIYTVISGVFYIGLGEEFDERKLTAHGPGSVLVLAVSRAPSTSGGSAASIRRQALALVTIPDSGWLTSCAIDAVKAPRLMTLATCASSDLALPSARSASARSASLLSRAAVPCVRSMAMLATRVTCSMRSC